MLNVKTNFYIKDFSYLVVFFFIIFIYSSSLLSDDINSTSLSDIKDKKINQLEELLQTYKKENILLRKENKELQEKIEYYKSIKIDNSKVKKISTCDKYNFLSCGVGGSSQTASSNTVSHDVFGMSNDNICNIAVASNISPKNWETSSHFKKYVDEAKRRGLSCGIIDPEKKKELIEKQKKLAEIIYGKSIGSIIRERKLARKLEEQKAKKEAVKKQTKLTESQTRVDSTTLNKPINCTNFDFYITEIVWETILSTKGLKKSKVLEKMHKCSLGYGVWTVKLGGGGANNPTIQSDGEYILFSGQGFSSKRVQCIKIRNPNKYYNRANVGSTIKETCW